MGVVQSVIFCGNFQVTYQYISSGIKVVQMTQQTSKREIIDIFLQPTCIGCGISQQVHWADAAIEQTQCCANKRETASREREGVLDMCCIMDEKNKFTCILILGAIWQCGSACRGFSH